MRCGRHGAVRRKRGVRTHRARLHARCRGRPIWNVAATRLQFRRTRTTVWPVSGEWGRQVQMLRVLQRAEQRLQSAPPGTVPPGLRDEVIGEILRAKYNVALFGGLGGAALTGRLANAVA